MTQENEALFKKIVKIEAKDASIYTLLTFLTQIGSFLVIPLFWRKLTPQDYGVIAIIDLISVFVLLFAGLSLDNSIPRFYYEWSELERKRNLGAVWIFNWANILIVGFISILILSFVSNRLFQQVDFYPYIYLGLINKVLTCLTAVPFQTIRIRKQPYIYCAYSLLNFLINLGMPIYYVLILNKGFMGYLTAGVISASIIAIGSAALMLFYCSPCLKSPGLKDSFKYALPMVPANIIANITGSVDSFILQRFVSLETLGIYFLSMKFSRIIFSLHAALKISYIPFIFKTISEHPLRQAKETISRISLLYILPILVAGLAISIFIKDFIFIINRPSYLPIVKYVPWLIMPSIMLSFYMYFTSGILLAKRTDLLWIPNLMQLIVVALASIIFIPILKMPGIIIVNYLNYMTYLFVSWKLSERVFPMPTRWRKLFILSAIMLAYIILINSFIVFQNIFISIAAKSVMIFLYGVTGFLVIAGFRRAKTVAVFYATRLLGKRRQGSFL